MPCASLWFLFPTYPERCESVSVIPLRSGVLAQLPLSPPIDIDRAEAQRRANEELLSRAKYGRLPDWLENLFEQATNGVNDVLRVLMGDSNTGGVGWGFIIVILIAVALVAFIIWRVGLPRWRRVAAPDATVELDQSVPPSAYRDAAEAAAARGDYRVAIRERFRAIVRELEFRTIIAPRPSRTAFEAAAVASRELPEATDAMYRAAELFCEVMYGDAPGTAEGWQHMLDAERVVSTAATQPLGATS